MNKKRATGKLKGILGKEKATKRDYPKFYSYTLPKSLAIPEPQECRAFTKQSNWDLSCHPRDSDCNEVDSLMKQQQQNLSEDLNPKTVSEKVLPNLECLQRLFHNVQDIIWNYSIQLNRTDTRSNRNFEYSYMYWRNWILNLL